MSGPSIQTRDLINQMDIRHHRNTVASELPLRCERVSLRQTPAEPLGFVRCSQRPPRKAAGRAAVICRAYGIRATRLTCRSFCQIGRKCKNGRNPTVPVCISNNYQLNMDKRAHLLWRWLICRRVRLIFCNRKKNDCFCRMRGCITHLN